MIFDPSIFYDTYLKDYHFTKAKYLKWMLDNLDKVERELYVNELDEEKRDSLRKTIKSDLRQTYFHSIETFFELFFAVNPKGKERADDRHILYKLTNSNWSEVYKQIKNIADDDSALDFLNEKIIFLNHEITIGRYIFYMGLFKVDGSSQKMHKAIDRSVEAIKYGIRILAREFTNREEYNAYKHALRIIPASTEFMIADAKSLEVHKQWDISDSMSFYSKTKNPAELTVVTKLFDSERDYQMISFCSNLIHNIINYRRIAINKKNKGGKSGLVEVRIFGKDAIERCSKVNVSIQDLVFTYTKE